MNQATKRKRSYNKAKYRRYEFSVDIDTKLNYLLEQYKQETPGSISGLVKGLLCNYFKVDENEIYIPNHFGDKTDQERKMEEKKHDAR